MTATIHLLCGSTGAGKTTYGKALAAAEGAIFLSVDRWMSALFWMDVGQPIDPAWAIARVDRCVALIWRTAAEAAGRGMPAVLEIGLTTRAARARIAEWSARDGVPIQLHLLDVPAAERWRRVAARNRATDDDAELGFAITRDQFDYVEAMWEAPDAGELAAMAGLHVGELAAG